jgi:hypothetical protein
MTWNLRAIISWLWYALMVSRALNVLPEGVKWRAAFAPRDAATRSRVEVEGVSPSTNALLYCCIEKHIVWSISKSLRDVFIEEMLLNQQQSQRP